MKLEILQILSSKHKSKEQVLRALDRPDAFTKQAAQPNRHMSVQVDVRADSKATKTHVLGLQKRKTLGDDYDQRNVKPADDSVNDAYQLMLHEFSNSNNDTGMAARGRDSLVPNNSSEE